jgi:genome maintenance exonuclease 1
MLSRDSIKQWRKRVGEEEANKVSSKAAQRGTRVHQLCEDYLNNQFELEKHSKFSIYDLESFVRIKSELDKIDNIYLQEQRLYSDHLKMAGTVDCVGEYSGKLSIIDFKTSRKLKDKDYILGYFCQATAYAIMFEELTGISVPRITIIISVDDEPPQVFTEYRDNYVDRLIMVRKQYEEEFGF